MSWATPANHSLQSATSFGFEVNSYLVPATICRAQSSFMQSISGGRRRATRQIEHHRFPRLRPIGCPKSPLGWDRSAMSMRSRISRGAGPALCAKSCVTCAPACPNGVGGGPIAGSFSRGSWWASGRWRVGHHCRCALTVCGNSKGSRVESAATHEATPMALHTTPSW
jgi:hypothetical protein